MRTGEKNDEMPKTGDAGELAFDCLCEAMDWEVTSLRTASGKPYDRVIRRTPEEGWITIQCKEGWVENRSGHQFVKNMSSNRRYVTGEYNFLHIFSLEKEHYLIPWEEVTDLYRINLTLTAKRWNEFKVIDSQRKKQERKNDRNSCSRACPPEG